jgi:lipoyl(octanoyl) transferase
MTIYFSKKNQRKLSNAVECIISDAPVDYLDAVDFMEDRVKSIRSGNALELVWLLEHPPIYTAGTSSKEFELLDKNRFPIYQSGRGGRYTYHGPGQRIVYVMLDLSKRGNDIRKFVHSLEEWIIRTLAYFNVVGEVHNDRIGIWVTQRSVNNQVSSEKKIAAIGVRIRKSVTFHGLAINIDPNLEHFSGIIPCGIERHGVTSLLDMGFTTTAAEVDAVLLDTFDNVFEKP